MTHSQAYRKNDQAWVEQKNGMDRPAPGGLRPPRGVLAGECLGRLYVPARLHDNLFQP